MLLVLRERGMGKMNFSVPLMKRKKFTHLMRKAGIIVVFTGAIMLFVTVLAWGFSKLGNWATQVPAGDPGSTRCIQHTYHPAEYLYVMENGNHLRYVTRLVRLNACTIWPVSGLPSWTNLTAVTPQGAHMYGQHVTYKVSAYPLQEIP
jgi:hypothetical protein